MEEGGREGGISGRVPGMGGERWGTGEVGGQSDGVVNAPRAHQAQRIGPFFFFFKSASRYALT